MCYKVATYLVSDREREYTVGLLRGHWLTGRLTAEEFEQRVGEAWRARSAPDLWRALRLLPPEPPAPVAETGGGGSAAGALVLGLVGLTLFVMTFGLGAPVALPLFVSAWALGRGAKRHRPVGKRGIAVAGEVIGLVGTVTCVLLLGACAAVVF